MEQSAMSKKISIVIGILVFILVMAVLLMPARAHAGLFEDALSGDAPPPAEQPNSDNGEKTASSGGTFGGFSGINFELNGYVRGVTYIGKVPDAEEAEVKSGYGEGALKLRVRTGKYGDGFTNCGSAPDTRTTKSWLNSICGKPMSTYFWAPWTFALASRSLCGAAPTALTPPTT